jgi:predicted nucleic acid-binding protein
MILVDANVFMYASGADPNRKPAIAFLESVADGVVDAAIDAEVLQEVIHRYTSLRRWNEGRRVYLIARQLFPEVLPITGIVLDKAKALKDQVSGLTARDAVHASVVSVYELEGICTFDRDFDQIPGCRRIEPAGKI